MHPSTHILNQNEIFKVPIFLLNVFHWKYENLHTWFHMHEQYSGIKITFEFMKAFKYTPIQYPKKVRTEEKAINWMDTLTKKKMESESPFPNIEIHCAVNIYRWSAIQTIISILCRNAFETEKKFSCAIKCTAGIHRYVQAHMHILSLM